MNIVIDIQGFKIENNKFIAKELAAYDGQHISHYIFKQPFEINLLPPDLHRQATWLTKNHHCIPWNEGFTPLHKFSDIIKTITNKGSSVFVKGKEKADTIRKYSSTPVFELEEQPALQPSESRCFFHTKNYCICALSNVFYLYNNFLMDDK